MDEKINFLSPDGLGALWEKIKEKFVPAGSAGTGSTEKEGLTKLYTGTGENTDGAMTQKAVTDTLTELGNTADAAFKKVFTQI